MTNRIHQPNDGDEDMEAREEERYYQCPESPLLRFKLQSVDEVKGEIERLRPLTPELWTTIQRKLKIDWTFDSNAIEGSTLTRGETAFFLEHGLTVEGKPFKDFVDARNHVEAITLLEEVVRDQRPLSVGLLKEINALLLKGVTQTAAINHQGQPAHKPATPGEYKKNPNHVLQPDGTIHYYSDPLQVPGEMERLVKWINDHWESLHPAVLGALAHYNMVRIHPFDDGNGRVGRLLMNLILMKKMYPPAVIRVDKRLAYLNALAEADQGNPGHFVELIADALLSTLTLILSDLKNGRKEA